jgi:hypothetical protein
LLPPAPRRAYPRGLAAVLAAQVEPSGVALRYFGTAVGKARQSCKNEIEKIKFDQITCREAVGEAAKM